MTAYPTQLSQAKSALFHKYLQGVHLQTLPGTAAITRHAPGAPAPLTLGQQQLWLLAQLEPHSPVFNEPITVGLPGPLDVAALEQSLSEIIRRHEIWRTTFPAVAGRPVQVVQEAPTVMLPVTDLRALPCADREAEALRLATEEARRPFDLARGPLLRTRLVRLDRNDYRLFITLHHIIMDGVSIYTVFLPELASLYGAFSRGEPSPLSELPIQYADYARWQQERLQDVHSAWPGELAYWREQLGSGLPVLQFPAARTRTATRTFRGTQQPFALPQDLTQDLKALSQREGATLFMTLLTAFKTLLYRYTGQDELLVGTAMADRKRLEAEKLLGFFLNVVPLRTSLSDDITFRELLGQVRGVLLGAFAHDSLPFEYALKSLQSGHDGQRTPFIAVMCNMEPPLPTLGPGWSLSQMDVDTGTAKRDLYLELDDRPEGIVGRWQYNTDIFDHATISRMHRHYQVLLESIVTNPRQRLTEIPLVTPPEQEYKLSEWNAPLC